MPQKAFITNTKTKTLKKRIEQLIEHSQELKFLVGFFYFSGWQQIYQTLNENEQLKLKILVGLEVDSKLGKTIEYALSADEISNDEKSDRFFESLSNAINSDEDEAGLLSNLKKQLELLNNTSLSQREFHAILNHLAKGNLFERSKTLHDRFQLNRDDGKRWYQCQKPRQYLIPRLCFFAEV